MMKGDEGQVKTEVSFIIEKNGSISAVKANGTRQDFNAEAVRTVKAVKNRWFPAKVNHQVVRYSVSCAACSLGQSFDTYASISFTIISD